MLSCSQKFSHSLFSFLHTFTRPIFLSLPLSYFLPRLSISISISLAFTRNHYHSVTFSVFSLLHSLCLSLCTVEYCACTNCKNIVRKLERELLLERAFRISFATLHNTFIADLAQLDGRSCRDRIDRRAKEVPRSRYRCRPEITSCEPKIISVRKKFIKNLQDSIQKKFSLKARFVPFVHGVYIICGFNKFYSKNTEDLCLLQFEMGQVSVYCYMFYWRRQWKVEKKVYVKDELFLSYWKSKFWPIE